jgi:Zn-dependent oligopeptidase
MLNELLWLETEEVVDSSNLTFWSQVSSDASIREASSAADKCLREFCVEMGARRDLFEAVKTLKERADELVDDSKTSLLVDDTLLVDGNKNACALLVDVGQRTRLLERMLRDFNRAGVTLDDDDRRRRIVEIDTRLSFLCVEFANELNADESCVELDDAELSGLDASVVQRLEVVDGDWRRLTMNYPDVMPALDQIESASVRRRVAKCFGSRCMAANTPRIEEALALRFERAQLMGRESHAAFVAETRMVEKVEHIAAFYDDLLPRLQELAARELDEMRRIKVEHLQLASADGVDIEPEDFRFYHHRQKRLLGVDDDAIKQYFPLDFVTEQLFAMFAELFGVRFEVADDEPVWHDDVTAYRVFDNVGGDGDVLGLIYFDLHPRAGKYTHAAVFPLQKRALGADNRLVMPVTALVCNFTRGSDDAPALLRHSETVTLFHECGHALHGILSTQAQVARFSGTSVERDFVEAPSQFLENWMWDKRVLVDRLSRHYQTGEPLDESVVDRMLALKNLNVGLLTLRQCFFGLLDQRMHGNPPRTGTEALAHELRKEITLIGDVEGTNLCASFGHLMGGYDAQYYGYLYSLVFSADLFEQFELRPSIVDADLGQRYRRSILSVGGTRHSLESLREFLGREPRNNAFLRQVGLN